ncbi:MAG: MMPL family transporter [Myxococcales bacterium]|nr:MMPL family transporter [Myxococcales bacterium]MCB9714556.1 MMPL family transporter [Myxococcales bacterium]
MSFAKRLFWWYRWLCLEHPRVTLLLVALATLGFMTQLESLEQDPNPYMLDDDHPSRRNQRRLMDTFTGSREIAVVGVVHEGSIFNPETLGRIAYLSERIELMSIVGDEQEAELEARAELWPGSAAALAQQVLREGVRADDVATLERIRELLEHEQELIADAKHEPVEEIDEEDDELLRRLVDWADPVREVTSLSTVDNIITSEDGTTMDVSAAMEEVPETQAEADAIERQVMDNPLLVDAVVSEDRHVASIRVELNIDPDDTAGMLAVYERIREEVEAVEDDLPPNTPESYAIGGTPVVSANMGALMEQDTNNLFPMVILVILVVLVFLLRSVRGTLVPLLIAVLSVIWTVGTMALVGVPMDIVTTMLPVFLIAIGVVDSVHFFSEQHTEHLMLGAGAQMVREEIEDQRGKRTVVSTPKLASIRHSVNRLFRPMMLTSLTSAAGFLAMAWSDIMPLHRFGIFVAIGIAYAFILTILLGPAISVFGDDPALGRDKKQWGRLGRAFRQTGIGTTMTSLGRFVQRRSSEILVVFVAITAVSAVFVRDVEVENRFVGYFDETTDIWKDDQVLNEHLGGTMPLYLMFSSPEEGYFGRADVLQRMAALEAELAREVEVGYVYSLVGFVERMNHVIHRGDQAFARIPHTTEVVMEEKTERTERDLPPDEPDGIETREVEIRTTQEPVEVSGNDLIAQYLLLYENAGGQDIRDVVDTDLREANTLLLLKSDRSSVASRLIERTRELAAKHLGDEVEVRFSGYAEVAASTTEEVVDSQRRAMGWTALVVFLVLLAYFRSIVLTIVTMIPLTAALLFNLSFMQAMEIPLSIGSAIVLTIAVGVGVDFAIHVVDRYRLESRGKVTSDAISSTMLFAGRAIFVGLMVISQGFSVLIGSGFTAIQHLGLLVALTMVWSALVSIFVLPAIFARIPFIRAGALTRELVK